MKPLVNDLFLEILDVLFTASQLAGVQKYVIRSVGPSFANMLGDWIQRGMTRKNRS